MSQDVASTFLAQAPLVLIGCDAAGRILFSVGRDAPRLLGEEQPPVARRLDELPAADPMLMALVARARAGERGTARLELEGQVLLLQVAPLDAGAGIVVIGMREPSRAPTVREPPTQAALLARARGAEALDQQLRQAQKMEAIERLAGGVAHDFNNLLTVIGGYANLLLETEAPDQLAAELAGEIKDASERAAQLTRQLLVFSGRQMLKAQVLDLNAVVAALEPRLRRLIGEDVELGMTFAPTIGRVKADPIQLDQVIINLVANAREAMPSGGKLTIATADVVLDEPSTQSYPGLAAGAYVTLAISDTGCGMTSEVKQRLFEPFFTTKEIGKGAGFGLATAYGIVKQSGGHIAVRSEPRVGSVFKVYLPLIETRG